MAIGSLGIGDRDQRHVVEARIERVEIGEVLAAVQRGDSAVRDVTKQGKMELIDVEMQNVKLVGPSANAIEHQHVIRDRVAHVGVETQRNRYARHQTRAGNGVSARKKRHLMARSDQLIGEI